MAATATRGRRYVGTSRMPHPAKKPDAGRADNLAGLDDDLAGLRLLARLADVRAPARPAGRTTRGFPACRRRTPRPLPRTSPRRRRRRAAGAPVMMRTHWPGRHRTRRRFRPPPLPRSRPAQPALFGRRGQIGRAHGEPVHGRNRAKGEMSMSLRRSAAATRPTASSIETVSTGKASTWESTKARASSSDIMSGIGSPFAKTRRLAARRVGTCMATIIALRRIGARREDCRSVPAQRAEAPAPPTRRIAPAADRQPLPSRHPIFSRASPHPYRPPPHS